MLDLGFRNNRMFAAAMTAVLLAGAVPGAAQEARFSNADGSIEIAGTVKAFDGDTYVIESLFGRLDISSDTVTCQGAGCPVRQISTSWSGGEVGEQISLASADGSLNISGRMVMFDGDTIQVRNSIGLLELPFEDMRCTGAGCPEAVEEITYVIPGS